MKARITLVTIAAFLTLGLALAQEDSKQYRFEVSVEKGKPSVLSGPDLKGISNGSARIGFSPSHNFQLTLTYTKWDGDLSRDDGLSSDFGAKFNKPRHSNEQVKFQDAVMDKRSIKLKQMELGIVKTIALGGSKHFETYIGLGLGLQKGKADISWTGFQPPPTDPNVKPVWQEDEKNQFLASVRGGLRYTPLPWVGVQLNLRVIPIARFFGQDYNGLELNGGVLFRFGKF